MARPPSGPATRTSVSNRCRGLAERMARRSSAGGGNSSHSSTTIGSVLPFGSLLGCSDMASRRRSLCAYKKLRCLVVNRFPAHIVAIADRPSEGQGSGTKGRDLGGGRGDLQGSAHRGTGFPRPEGILPLPSRQNARGRGKRSRCDFELDELRQSVFDLWTTSEGDARGDPREIWCALSQGTEPKPSRRRRHARCRRQGVDANFDTMIETAAMRQGLEVEVVAPAVIWKWTAPPCTSRTEPFRSQAIRRVSPSATTTTSSPGFTSVVAERELGREAGG